MKPRMRPRKPASIGSNQASPANSPSGLAAVVLSLSMAWSPPARQRRALVVESQPETTSPHFQPHPGRDRARLGLWRRLGQRLALDWRLACGDEALPSAVVVDSRSLRSAPSAWARGIDGGKLVKGIKLFVVSDRHGSLLDLELHPANTDDRAGTLPTLPRLAALGFQGDLLGDSGFKGAPFAAAALAHDIHVAVSPGGTREGRFLPNGIRWVVERLFAWMSRYRRLNIVYDRAPDLFAAHIWIAMISIISRRLVAQTQPQ